MSADYVERIRKLDWEGLRSLWQQIETRSTPSWTDGKALEHLVLRGFELGGATVQWPYEVRVAGEPMEQIDGAVHFGSLSCLVECKDTAEKVNVEPIAKLRNQLLRRHASSVGLLFSTGGFTESALTLAQYLAPQSVLLWKGAEIAFHLEREDFCSALLLKYRHSIETGVPDHDLREAGVR
jgi:hypothetical protein